MIAGTIQPVRGRQLGTRVFEDVSSVEGVEIKFDVDVKELSFYVTAAGSTTKQDYFWIKGTGEYEDWVLQASNPYAIGIAKPSDSTVCYIKGAAGTSVDVHCILIR